MTDNRTAKMVHNQVLPRRHNVWSRAAPKSGVHSQVVVRQLRYELVVVDWQVGRIGGFIPQFEHPKGVLGFNLVDGVSLFLVREVGLTVDFAGKKAVCFVKRGEVEWFQDGIHVRGQDEGAVEDGRQPQHVRHRDQVVTRVAELILDNEYKRGRGAFFRVVLFVTMLCSFWTTQRNMFQDRKPLFQLLPYVWQRRGVVNMMVALCMGAGC